MAKRLVKFLAAAVVIVVVAVVAVFVGCLVVKLNNATQKVKVLWVSRIFSGHNPPRRTGQHRQRIKNNEQRTTNDNMVWLWQVGYACATKREIPMATIDHVPCGVLMKP